MAENKDNSRADLFQILNELHDEQPKDASSAESTDNGQAVRSESRVEELIKILSTDTEQGEGAINENGATDEESQEIEVPSALFDHLSSESELPPEVILSQAISSHFTDESEVVIEPVEGEIEEEADTEEAEAEEEENEEEPISNVKKVGKFFRGMSFLPKALIYMALVLMASAYLSYYIITIGNDIFALVTDSREVTIVIEEGATNKTVAKLLEEKDVIKYGWVYELYMKYRDDGDGEDTYIAGEHILNQDFNYSQIINALTKAKSEREVKRITIPEGYTVEQIITLLVDNGIGQRSDYIEAINNYPYKWEFVQQLTEIGYSADRKYRLEGYLYPDTYDFSTTEDEVYVINKMLNAFNDKFWREFIKTDADGNSLQKHMLDEYNMTFDDVIVLASVIQSEGGTAEDFYYVSYVFHNRLKNVWYETNGKLESDATIQYVLPQRVEAEKVDTNYDTPYNTYTYKGLPPGAISNAGSDALSAALYPEPPKNENDREIDAYYFVANKAGKTYYAHNESGHLSNRNKVDRDNAAIEAGTYEG